MYDVLYSKEPVRREEGNPFLQPGGVRASRIADSGLQEAPVARNEVFDYPTGTDSQFARAMSRIACHVDSASQGKVKSKSDLKMELNEQLSLALAIQMGLNGVSQVNERALLNVRTSKSARGDLKQVLQSREELYGASLDPGWFKRGYSLGTKAKSTNQRNKARSLLAAAPLTVAQMGA